MYIITQPHFLLLHFYTILSYIIAASCGELNPQRLNINKKIDDLLPLLQRDFLISILNNTSYSKKELKKRLNRLKMALFFENPFYIFLARINYRKNLTEDINSVNNDIDLYTTMVIISEFFNNQISIIPFVYCGDMVFFLQPNSSFGKDENQIFSNYINGVLEKIQQDFFDLTKKTVSFTLLNSQTSISECHISYLKLKSIMNYNYNSYDEFIINDKTQENAKDYYFNQLEVEENYKQKRLLNTAENFNIYLENNADLSKKHLESIINYADSKKFSLDSDIGNKLFYSLTNSFLSHIIMIGIKNTIEDKFDISLLSKIQCFNNWNDVKIYLTSLIKTICEEKEYSQAKKNRYLVEKVNTFILNNLDSDLSLTKIADHVHFNPYYLSRLYKKITDKNIKHFIIETKINVAKELLKNENMMISNISENLGFSQHAYFTRFFKKHTGLTPTQFREN